MHLYTEARALALEAFTEAAGDLERAEDFLRQSCDYHEVVVYYAKAIRFCAEQNTSAGEQWLDDCWTVYEAGDSFGNIACRIAFATLFCASVDVLQEIAGEAEEVDAEISA